MKKAIGKLLIIGDSYSTFEGCVPDGYKVYYGNDERSVEFGVTSPEKTWWGIFKRESGAELIENNSWSGSPVSYIGWNDVDCSKSSSFVYRLRELAKEDFARIGKPDTLLIFGATNDSWIGTPLGEAKFSDITEMDLRTVLPAISAIIGEARAALPDTRIIYMINTELKPEITEHIKAASEHFGTEYIELSNIDKMSGHPTALGMRRIAEQLLEFLK